MDKKPTNLLSYDNLEKEKTVNYHKTYRLHRSSLSPPKEQDGREKLLEHSTLKSKGLQNICFNFERKKCMI